ncbi:MAG: class I SAM-dependent methyltransferase [Terriglobales bacterium]
MPVAFSSPSPPSQQWNAAAYAANAHFVPALGQPVLDLLQPKSGERILDLGCGDGMLTEKLVALGAQVVGVDSSADMIGAALHRVLDARLMDARALVFENEFDAVFSNAVLHWIKDDPAAPIAGAFRTLKSGGRFVGELGGHGCVGAISVALVAMLECRGVKDAASWIPWYFPTVQDYKMRLRRSGFVPRSVELIPRPTPLPTGMRGWLNTFANRSAPRCRLRNAAAFWMTLRLCSSPFSAMEMGIGRRITLACALLLSNPEVIRQ